MRCGQTSHQAKQTNLKEVLTATKALQEHRSDVAKSQSLEEALRTASPLAAQKPVLCVMTDGMDQAHWSVPRLPQWKGPKRFSEGKVRRPRCKVQGVWCFFYSLHIVVADSVQPHDSSFTAEVIARTLERCRAVAEARGLPRPFGPITRSGRTKINGFCSSLLAWWRGICST